MAGIQLREERFNFACAVAREVELEESMKRFVVLLIVFSVLMCSLCSCSRNIKEITINEKTAALTIEETDMGVEITFDGEEYSIFTRNIKGLYFYNIPYELVACYWSRHGILGLFAVNNPDFGTAFITGDPLFKENLRPYARPKYYLSENTKIPTLESIAINDIFCVANVGFIQNVVYTEWSTADDISLGWTANLWNSENNNVLLGDIIDFEEPFTLVDKNMIYAEIIFTPKDYDSFFCGPFKLFEIDGEYYIQFMFFTDDENAYRVRDEYQFIFQD